MDNFLNLKEEFRASFRGVYTVLLHIVLNLGHNKTLNEMCSVTSNLFEVIALLFVL